MYSDKLKVPWFCYWWVIIILMPFVHPIAILLAMDRNIRNSHSILNGSRMMRFVVIRDTIITMVMGIILIAIAEVVFFLFLITEKNSYNYESKFIVIMCIITYLISMGAGLIYSGEYLKKRARRNSIYMEMIINYGVTNLDEIAKNCNVKYSRLIKELKLLIKMKILENVSISKSKHLLVIKNIETSESSQINNNQSQEDNQVTCSCPGCGVKLRLSKGTFSQCTFCNTPVYSK